MSHEGVFPDNDLAGTMASIHEIVIAGRAYSLAHMMLFCGSVAEEHARSVPQNDFEDMVEI